MKECKQSLTNFQANITIYKKNRQNVKMKECKISLTDFL